MRLVLPRLYVILDAALIPSSTSEMDCAIGLAEAGVRLMQYRNKAASGRRLYDSSRDLTSALKPLGVSLLVNDRADVAALTDAAGVHVGQDDLDVEAARALVGSDKWVGVSTHNVEQLRAAAATSAEYIAIGPVFPTSSKANPDPVVGLDFLRRVRPMTDKALVAIGGISLDKAAQVIEAGADSVAVISGILSAADPLQEARRYLQELDAAKRVASV